MELKLFNTGDISIHNYNWDIDVVDGIPVLVDEGEETAQIAMVSAYLAVGSIPLMEDKGNDWAGYLLRSKTLAQLDSQVRSNINTYTESSSYVPVYNIRDEQLTVEISKVYINSGAM